MLSNASQFRRTKIVPWVVSALLVAGVLLRFIGAAWLLTVLRVLSDRVEAWGLARSVLGEARPARLRPPHLSCPA